MKVCIWPDDTSCEIADLEDFLTFMSDDYIIVYIDYMDEIPLYDEAIGGKV